MRDNNGICHRKHREYEITREPFMSDDLRRLPSLREELTRRCVGKPGDIENTREGIRSWPNASRALPDLDDSGGTTAKQARRLWKVPQHCSGFNLGRYRIERERPGRHGDCPRRIHVMLGEAIALKVLPVRNFRDAIS
jgi:hypothetical protein